MAYQQDVKKALVAAGNKNRYQYIVLILLCTIFYFDAFLLLGPSFYFMDPTFICDGSDEIVDQKQACPRIAQCHIVNDFTITKYMGLYCDRQHERDLIQSLLSVGSLLGLVLMNFLSDLRGRRLALFIDLVIAVLSSFLTIVGTYAQSTVVLIMASIMAGFSGYSLVIVSYIVAGDVCQQQIRQKSSLYMNMSYSVGIITYFFLYNWINQWYNILFLLMLIPFLGLTVICSILIQQSPNYYLCKKKDKKKCIQSLTNIALYNEKPQSSIQQIQKIITNSQMSQSEKNAQKSKASVLSVLKQWKFLKIIIFMSIVQSGGNLFFYGIQYAIDDIGFNYGADNLVIGTTEIIVTLVLTNFVSRLPRKKTLFIAYLSTVGVVFLFVIKPIQQSNVACTILIILVRTLTTIGYFMIVMIQTQSFPLQIHSIGAGTIEAFAQMGSIAAPLVITFAINHGLQKMATMGVILFFCLIPLKFVPQPSHGHQLPKQQLKQTLLDSQIQ